MQSQKTRRPKFVNAKLILLIATVITAVLLLLSFSAAAENAPHAMPATCPTNLLNNPGFEFPVETPNAAPLNWTTSPWTPVTTLSRDHDVTHTGFGSVKITTITSTDAWYAQEVTVEPNTTYMLTGWIKTQSVSYGTGANLSVLGTSTHTEGLTSTHDWTFVRLWFDSDSNTRITIAARLGYSGQTSGGTAWFDDLRLTPLRLDDPHPRWKILVLIYDKTDAVLTDGAGVLHHMVGAMTAGEVDRATDQATQFVETDIPALTSGNMIPELTIRHPDHPLTQLERLGDSWWWPSPASTVLDHDPTFDSVIVIWDPRVVDQYNGTSYWIGGYAGLTPSMGTGQTYAAIIIEATGYGHRNVFKHEWGHSILSYFDAARTAPQPTVTNHAVVNQYVHWPTGGPYVWIDETDANPVPNSIYNNESGFTHDYYSGTTATADEPTRRLGITPKAWMLGGPVTRPGTAPPPVIATNADVSVASSPGTCTAVVTITPPTAYDECGGNLKATATRDDGLSMDAPYSCGRTVVTWTTTNADNISSISRQVVTVRDEEPPVFVSTFPAITVMNGSDPTSCGVVVDDAALRIGPYSHLIVFDAGFDALPVVSGRTADIISIRSTFNSESLEFKVEFNDLVFPPSSTDSSRAGLFGFIEVDTDQNPATGIPSSAGTFFFPQLNLGVDYLIDVGSERRHPGVVDIVSRGHGPAAVVGQVPISFSEQSFSVSVPLALLGGDNGLVNYDANLGVAASFTDRVPNGAEPATSVPSSEVLAIDNHWPLTVTRSGVPANNLFPVGETVITYTATDASGNSTSVTQIVKVIDNTPPIIEHVAADPATLWPPNHQMVDVTVNYDVVECAIAETSLSVSSDDPDAASDWEVVDAHHVRLRAKRSPRVGDRVYTITITAKDTQGNSASQQVTVRVPQRNEKGGG